MTTKAQFNSWKTQEDKKKVLQYYTNLGLECTDIEGDKEEAQIDWTNATGIGIRLGGKTNIRAIDIDGFMECSNNFNSPQHSAICNYSRRFFLQRCLNILGLPEDYEWLINTPHGWHILFTAPSFGFENTSFASKKEYTPKSITGNVIQFRRIDLLWEGHLVMPPSQQGVFSLYYFQNHLPQSLPVEINVSRLLDFINFYCGTFEYIHYMTDCYSTPIIGDGHYFPQYKLNRVQGSQDFGQTTHKADFDNDIEFLHACNSPAALNTLGVNLIKEDLKNNYKIEKNLKAALNYFRMANDACAHYNIACLCALGCIPTNEDEFYQHLNLAIGFPEEYKEQLIVLYLANNKVYEKYAIIDVSTTYLNRIHKVAILLTDARGHILRDYFDELDSEGNCLNNQCQMENIFNMIQQADYIVGRNLGNIIDLHRKESELIGNPSYLDTFMRPKIDLPIVSDNEDDPQRRIYHIKNQFVEKMRNGMIEKA